MNNRSLTIRLDEELDLELDAACAATGRSRGEIDDAPAMTPGFSSQEADTSAAPTALWRRFVRGFWLPSELTAVRAHCAG